MRDLIVQTKKGGMLRGKEEVRVEGKGLGPREEGKVPLEEWSVQLKQQVKRTEGGTRREREEKRIRQVGRRRKRTDHRTLRGRHEGRLYQHLGGGEEEI